MMCMAFYGGTCFPFALFILITEGPKEGGYHPKPDSYGVWRHLISASTIEFVALPCVVYLEMGRPRRICVRLFDDMEELLL
jgi:hypothetical protein